MIEQYKIDLLQQSDPVLSKIINQVGLVDYKINNSNYFKSASRIIVGQQLSLKAAKTIWNRLDSLVIEWTPDFLATIDIKSMRTAGVSNQKALYIKELAYRLKEKTFSFSQITTLKNEDATLSLMGIKGFGAWSAEMFLISSLGREDVFSVSDAGLRRSIMTAYQLDKESYTASVKEISNEWSPYRSIASLYLWEWIDTL